MPRRISKRQEMQELIKEMEDKAFEKRVQDKEDRLKNLVAPIESYIKSAEVLLTWEFPFVSALFACAIFVLLILFYNVNALVAIAVCGYIYIFVFSLTVFLHSTETEESADGWIQVQPRSEGEFDLISTVAWCIVTFETIWSNGMQLRKDDRDKFDIIGLCICFFLLIVGWTLSDFALLCILATFFLLLPALKYNKELDNLFEFPKPSLVSLENKLNLIRTSRPITFVLLWPVVKYNKLADNLFASVISFFAVLEKCFNIKRTVNPRKVRRQLRKQMLKESVDVRQIGENAEEDHGDDSDADLQEFIPPEESFPPLMEGSKHDDNIDEEVYEDEDSDAQEFLPDESILSDSRDATDDEYLPGEPTSLSMDEKLDSSKQPLPAGKSGDKMKNEEAVANIGKAEKKENDKDADDGFSDGLKFENVDKYDYVGDIKQNNASSRLGGLLNQAASMGKTLAGFNLLKYTLGSVIGSSSTAEPVNPANNDRESPTADDQFDLNGVELEAFAIPDN